MDKTTIKSLLSGTSPRLILEGSFSEISVELQDMRDLILGVIDHFGDFVYLSEPTADVQNTIKEDFESWLDLFAEGLVDVRPFVKSALSKNPDITIGELIRLVSDKFIE